MKYGNRSSWNRFVSSPITLIIAVAACFVMVRAATNIYQKSKASEGRLRESVAALNELRQYEKEMMNRVDYLSSADGVESEIRTKFRAASPGESLAVIIDEPQPTSTDSSKNIPKPTWWQKFLQTLGL